MIAYGEPEPGTGEKQDCHRAFMARWYPGRSYFELDKLEKNRVLVAAVRLRRMQKRYPADGPRSVHRERGPQHRRAA